MRKASSFVSRMSVDWARYFYGALIRISTNTRIYANALQAAGRPATEAKGSRGAAERHAGGESKC